jgi:arsenate reductase
MITFKRRKKMKILEYPKCTTCKKALKYLNDHNIKYEDINIKENNPNSKELKEYIKKSNKDINKFFNTSGLKYKELNLKDKLKTMTDEEKIELLSTDGMLVKRPLLINNDIVLVGFKEEEWEKIL